MNCLTIIIPLVIATSGVHSIEKLVLSPQELQSAIETAAPGDIINLGANYFKIPPEIPTLTCSQSGTPLNPITLTTTLTQVTVSGSSSDIDTGTGGGGTATTTAFTVTGNHWVFKGFKISGFETGILIQSANSTVINSMGIYDCTVGIHIQDGQQQSTDTKYRIARSLIDATKYGIQITASDNVEISGTSITAPDEAIFAESGTCCGIIRGNSIFGFVNIQGRDYVQIGNMMHPPEALDLVDTTTIPTTSADSTTPSVESTTTSAAPTLFTSIFKRFFDFHWCG